MVVPEADERVFSDPFFPQSYHGALTAFADDPTCRWCSAILSNPAEAPGRRQMVRYLESGHVDDGPS